VRVLGLDYGRVRIGLALSDPRGVIAIPLEVYRRGSLEEDLRKMKNIIEEHRIRRIVVGLPLNMNGSEGPQALETRGFVEVLQGALDCPIEMWDERLTSRIAERAMLEGDLSRAKRKKHRDKIAACVMLQGYLDRMKLGGDQ